jgi:hypothetical protein
VSSIQKNYRKGLATNVLQPSVRTRSSEQYGLENYLDCFCPLSGCYFRLAFGKIFHKILYIIGKQNHFCRLGLGSCLCGAGRLNAMICFNKGFTLINIQIHISKLGWVRLISTAHQQLTDSYHCDKIC